MPSHIKEVELLEDDRVAVIIDGQIVKVRVAEIMNQGRVRVTRSQGDAGSVFLRAQIYPLYRYVQLDTPLGQVSGIVPLCAA
jgi:hypothetical protein